MNLPCPRTAENYFNLPCLHFLCVSVIFCYQCKDKHQWESIFCGSKSCFLSINWSLYSLGHLPYASFPIFHVPRPFPEVSISQECYLCLTDMLQGNQITEQKLAPSRSERITVHPVQCKFWVSHNKITLSNVFFRMNTKWSAVSCTMCSPCGAAKLKHCTQ